MKPYNTNHSHKSLFSIQEIITIKMSWFYMVYKLSTHRTLATNPNISFNSSCLILPSVAPLIDSLAWSGHCASYLIMSLIRPTLRKSGAFVPILLDIFKIEPVFPSFATALSFFYDCASPKISYLSVAFHFFGGLLQDNLSILFSTTSLETCFPKYLQKLKDPTMNYG